jgi:aminoglycoside phosphotransferase family enzyme/predicted kinase
VLVAGLREPGAFPHPTGPVDAIETHISTVVLAGEFAYKIKKPVDLGFVNFSSLDLRRHFCGEEIRLNRRSAPDLYLDVVPIGAPLQRPRVGVDPAAALEFAVRMRRFPDDARLDRVARSGRLAPAHIDRLAAVIADFHMRCGPAPVDRGYGTPQDIRRWAVENLSELHQHAAAGPLRDDIERLQGWSLQELAKREAVIAARRADGHVRECHGDLHLGNLVLLGETPLPFDCIEFNDRLRFIDVINDVAFLFMDLLEHGLSPFAWRFLGGWLERSGDYAGLALLRFYAVYRALVRAKVAQIRLGQPATPPAERLEDEAAVGRYVGLAVRLARPPPPRLILTCGPAGSGKTTVGGMLLERIGAVRVRSDLERKRLSGLDPGTHRIEAVGDGLYGADATRRTYQRLAEAAEAILDAAIPAIVDATFLARGDRQAFRELARRRGVPFSIVACQAPAATLRARVAQRLQQGSDPSDATLQVLEHQLASFEPLTADEEVFTIRVDTDTDRENMQGRVEQVAATLTPGPSPTGAGEGRG